MRASHLIVLIVAAGTIVWPTPLLAAPSMNTGLWEESRTTPGTPSSTLRRCYTKADLDQLTAHLKDGSVRGDGQCKAINYSETNAGTTVSYTMRCTVNDKSVDSAFEAKFSGDSYKGTAGKVELAGRRVSSCP